MNYSQCYLTRDDKGKTKIQVAWIPEKYATAKNVIQLKVNGKWQNGWVVTDVYGNRSEDSIQKSEQAFRDFQITLGE